MFKVGIIGDEASQDFQTVVDMAIEFNLNSIEIRSVWEKAPQELTDQDIDKMKQILKDTDVEVIGIASPFYKCDPQLDDLLLFMADGITNIVMKRGHVRKRIRMLKSGGYLCTFR